MLYAAFFRAHRAPCPTRPSFLRYTLCHRSAYTPLASNRSASIPSRHRIQSINPRHRVVAKTLPMVTPLAFCLSS